LIHENKSFDSIFVDDEVDKIIYRVMRFLMINTHDDKKEWWQFCRLTTFCERLINETQKSKWTHKRRFLFWSRVFLCKLSIVFCMSRRQDDVKLSMNLIIIIIYFIKNSKKFNMTIMIKIKSNIIQLKIDIQVLRI
jgi:hypothetical protein